MEKKLNGFNNGRDTTDGVGGQKPIEFVPMANSSPDNSKLNIQSVTHSALLEASKAIVSNIETWLDTGDPADSKTSKMLYDNLKKAIVDVEHCG